LISGYLFTFNILDAAVIGEIWHQFFLPFQHFIANTTKGIMIRIIDQAAAVFKDRIPLEVIALEEDYENASFEEFLVDFAEFKIDC
jgi:hypothetical protein